MSDSWELSYGLSPRLGLPLGGLKIVALWEHGSSGLQELGRNFIAFFMT